jgi:hypothetical protein
MASRRLARRSTRTTISGLGGRIFAGAVLVGAVIDLGIMSASGATGATCSSVSVQTVDSALGIDAAKVNSTRPPSPAGALICSYYGLSGNAANEATINFLPATSTQFLAVENSLAKQHRIVNVPGIKSGAYHYHLAPNNFMFVLDGSMQVQMFATVSVAKLERLARNLPLYS